MKNAYEVLRQKELEVSRLKQEVEALRVADPLLLADGEAEDHRSTLQRAVNETPQPDHSGLQTEAKGTGKSDPQTTTHYIRKGVLVHSR
jgi:hypothetical protein